VNAGSGFRRGVGFPTSVNGNASVNESAQQWERVFPLGKKSLDSTAEMAQQIKHFDGQ
jgi:hypothetical protein